MLSFSSLCCMIRRSDVRTFVARCLVVEKKTALLGGSVHVVACGVPPPRRMCMYDVGLKGWEWLHQTLCVGVRDLVQMRTHRRNTLKPQDFERTRILRMQATPSLPPPSSPPPTQLRRYAGTMLESLLSFFAQTGIFPTHKGEEFRYTG